MDDIKEFLVSLGYDVRDEKSWRDAVEKTTKLAAQLGDELNRLAKRLAQGFSAAALGFADLEFKGQRTGASVANMKALSYAYEQAGASASSAEDAVESLARQLRIFPGKKETLRQWGIATEANGKHRDTVDILLDIADKLNKEPNRVVAEHDAAQMGLSSAQFVHLSMYAGRLRAMRDASLAAARAAGMDSNKAGKTSVLLTQAWRQTGMSLDLMLQAVMVRLAPTLIPIVQSMDEWMKRNRDAIANTVRDLIDAIADMVKAVAGLVEALDPLWSRVGGLLGAVFGDKGLLIATEAIGAVWIASIALRMLGVVTKLRTAFAALAVAFLVGRYLYVHSDQGDATRSSEGQQGGFFGRAWGRAKSALGFGGGSGGEGKAETPANVPSGADIDRREQAKEIDDPKVRARLLALTDAEVGGQGAAAAQAFMETIFNRAAARGKSLWETMHGSYFPAITHSKTEARMFDPALEKQYAEILDRVRRGSNISRGATGNASGTVGFGSGGFGTSSFGGERYGVEGPDIKWYLRQRAREKQVQDKLKRLEDLGNRFDKMTTAWGSPYDPSVSPLQSSLNLESNRTTKIVVHGDRDPRRTVSDVEKVQLRLNGDFVDSTGRAFA